MPEKNNKNPENISHKIVNSDFVNERLDVFLAKVCDQIPSRSFASKLIDNHFVLINGKERKASYKLKENEVVSIDLSFLDSSVENPEGENIPIEILFEDQHILVVNKQAGLVVHPGAGVHTGTLVNAVLWHCGFTLPSLGGNVRAGIVHRLDRDTSGVIVVAKTQIALTDLSKQFAEHNKKRIYYAVIYGTLKEKTGTVETWHGRDPQDRIKYAVQEEGKGKQAIMTYRVVSEFCEGLFSLVECTLKTGRTHQIRVQLSWLGGGIVGDSLYTKIPDKVKNHKSIFSCLKKIVQRQLLHAFFLEITHPATKEKVQYTANIPKDMNDFIQQLKVFKHDV